MTTVDFEPQDCALICGQNPRTIKSPQHSAPPSILAATQRPFAARCLTDKTPSAIGWKTIPSWFVIGDADKVIPPDILLKFATRAKSKVYHVPGGDHPSMIGHPEITVAAIRDAASAVSP